MRKCNVLEDPIVAMYLVTVLGSFSTSSPPQSLSSLLLAMALKNILFVLSECVCVMLYIALQSKATYQINGIEANKVTTPLNIQRLLFWQQKHIIYI